MAPWQLLRERARQMTEELGLVSDLPDAPAACCDEGASCVGEGCVQAQEAADPGYVAGAATDAGPAQQKQQQQQVSSSSKLVGLKKSHCRRQFDLASLEEALQIAAQSASAEADGLGEWVDNTWDASAKLRPMLSLVAQREFSPPPHFQQAMDACMQCLLHAPEGHLAKPQRMLELLDSPEAREILRYLEWLEEALKMASSSSSDSSASFVPGVTVAGRIRSALCSWPAECALLQQSATDLWEALMQHGPEHHHNLLGWRQAMEKRQKIQQQGEEDCRCIDLQLKSAVASFSQGLQASAGAEWTQVARTSVSRLQMVHDLTRDLLENKELEWMQSRTEFEALSARSNACRAAAFEARRHVRRHEQGCCQVAQRFAEVAHKLVSWTSLLVPKLQLLMSKRAELRTILELRQRLPALEQEHLAAEDDLDAARTDLRRHHRHAQAARARRVGRKSDVDMVAVLEDHSELRVAHAGERVETLAKQGKDELQRLQEAEAALGIILEHEDEESEGGSGAENGVRGAAERLSAEERLALKLATLEQYHDDVVVEVSSVQAERDALQQVAEQKAQEALKKRVEPDFLCPIMHECMVEPVLAADGHTYERQAIEKWLMMHNTSPMTGVPLAHRYLTENFALRSLIDAYTSGALEAPACASSVSPRSQHKDSGDSNEVMPDSNREDDYLVRRGLRRHDQTTGNGDASGGTSVGGSIGSDGTRRLGGRLTSPAGESLGSSDDVDDPDEDDPDDASVPDEHVAANRSASASDAVGSASGNSATGGVSPELSSYSLELSSPEAEESEGEGPEGPDIRNEQAGTETETETQMFNALSLGAARLDEDEALEDVDEARWES